MRYQLLTYTLQFFVFGQFLESLNSGDEKPFGNITAVTTGPAPQPLPTSSIPQRYSNLIVLVRTLMFYLISY
jgi:hypothetical protein